MASKMITHEKIISKGNMSELRGVIAKILCLARSFDYTEDEVFSIHLSLEEAIVNAVKHGNDGDIEKTVTVEYSVTPQKADVIVTDEGSGFDPDKLKDPRFGENLYKSDGRGVLLIKSYMDFVEYIGSGKGVHLIKYRHKSMPAQ